MKKLITIIATFFILMTAITVSADMESLIAKIAPFTVKINDKEFDFSDDIVVINDKTYIPLRDVSEALGKNVEWDDRTKTISISDRDDYKEMYYSLGMKLKALSDKSDLDKPAIIVNGLTITIKDIETAKIHGEFTNNFSLKEKIQKMIREKVEIADADRLKIEPDYEKLHAYLERTKEALSNSVDDKEIIQSYMDAMQLTEEEYFNSLEEIEYTNFQRMNWWETVKPKEIIQSEAKRRNVRVEDVDYEYREKYVDELVQKAEIEILDSEIQKVLSD